MIPYRVRIWWKWKRHRMHWHKWTPTHTPDVYRCQCGSRRDASSTTA